MSTEEEGSSSRSVMGYRDLALIRAQKIEKRVNAKKNVNDGLGHVWFQISHLLIS